MKEIEYVIPGSTYHFDSSKQRHYFLGSGKSTKHSALTSKEYCEEKGEELYDFLVKYTPAGIYKKLVCQIIEGDLSCNKYLKELLREVKGKECPGCGEIKPLSEYYIYDKVKHYSACKRCTRAREKREYSPEKRRKKYRETKTNFKIRCNREYNRIRVEGLH